MERYLKWKDKTGRNRSPSLNRMISSFIHVFAICDCQTASHKKSETTRMLKEGSQQCKKGRGEADRN